MNIKALTGLAALAMGVASVRASVVYDLSSGPGNNFYQGLKEFGDELHLGGTDRVIESFSFDYFANYAETGGLTFRIYANDGALIGGSHTPGTVLDVRSVDVANGGGHVQISFPIDAANVIPDTLTYTVTFSSITDGLVNRGGLILPNANPTTGSSFDDIWQRTGPGASDWALVQATDPGTGLPVIANFRATITAVPEPGTIALMALGAAGLLIVRRRRA